MYLVYKAEKQEGLIKKKNHLTNIFNAFLPCVHVCAFNEDFSPTSKGL